MPGDRAALAGRPFLLEQKGGNTMPSFDNWYEALYGPRQIGFTPQWTKEADTGNTGVTPVVPVTTPNIQPPRGDGSQDGGLSGGGDDRSFPTLNDPAYWGGWTPDLSWKDVMKGYGKYMGNPMLGGLAMLYQFMNPTKDPVWQKAAEQYLSEFAPNTTLDQLIEQINQIYKTNPDAKVFASDTIRGMMMSMNPEYAQAFKSWTDAGGSIHGFAQEVQGLQEMASAFPGLDISTAPMPGTAYGQQWNEVFKYSSNPNNMEFNWNTKEYEPTGTAYAGMVAQHQQNATNRQLSKQWMDEVLDGTTTLGLNDWKQNNSGIYGKDQDGNDIGRADHSGISGQTGDGYGISGDPRDRIR